MDIAWPVLSSLEKNQWIETGTFHRFAVRPPLDHHRCFHTPHCSLSHAHRDPQPNGQIAVCRGTGRR